MTRFKSEGTDFYLDGKPFNFCSAPFIILGFQRVGIILYNLKALESFSQRPY